MIRTWPGQTKEEWLAEYDRDEALTDEERDREFDEYLRTVEEESRKLYEEAGVKATKPQTADEFFKNCDHPNSLENDEATILWIIVMAIATIFKGNWIIWIVATIIWWRYITRHKRR